MSKKKIDPLLPFKWAQEELKKGIKEILGRTAHNKRIIWYHAFTLLKATEDEVPWCSSFMNAAAASTGFPYTKSAAAKSWLKYGEEGDGSVGDIAVFTRGETGGHVAFINSPYKKGDKFVEVLGGNQGDTISVAKYKAENLLAIRRFPDTV